MQKQTRKIVTLRKFKCGHATRALWLWGIKDKVELHWAINLEKNHRPSLKNKIMRLHAPPQKLALASAWARVYARRDETDHRAREKEKEKERECASNFVSVQLACV